MLLKQIVKGMFSSASIMRTAQGLTIFLCALYFMPNHSGSFAFTGLLLDKDEHTVGHGYVFYEFKLTNNSKVNRGQVDVLPSGYFSIYIPNINIEYVEITGIWQKDLNDEAENLLLEMSTSQETSMLFEPGWLLWKNRWHWSPKKDYIFQIGSPVRLGL